jgi:hypothetical protein
MVQISSLQEALDASAKEAESIRQELRQVGGFISLLFLGSDVVRQSKERSISTVAAMEKLNSELSDLRSNRALLSTNKGQLDELQQQVN